MNTLYMQGSRHDSERVFGLTFFVGFGSPMDGDWIEKAENLLVGFEIVSELRASCICAFLFNLFGNGVPIVSLIVLGGEG